MNFNFISIIYIIMSRPSKKSNAIDPQTQAIINQLQAGNLGTEKLLINVNGKVSRNTNSNNRIQYDLNDPIKLQVGDKITLYQAFLNERGLNENTISFEEDITETIRFLYYKQGDVHDAGFITPPALNTDYPSYSNAANINGGGTAFKMFPTPTQDAFLLESGNDVDHCGKLYSTFCSIDSVKDAVAATPNQTNVDMRKINGAQVDFNYTSYNYDVYGRKPNNTSSTLNLGCNGQLYYMYESCEFAGQLENNNLYPIVETSNFKDQADPDTPPDALRLPSLTMRPVYGKTQIKIKAGNYSVDSLASLIKEQLNGSLGVEDDTLQSMANALTEKLYKPSRSVMKANLGNMTDTTPFFDDIAEEDTNLDAEYLVNDKKYWNTEQFIRTNGGMVVDMKTMMPNQNGGNWTTLCYNQTIAQGLTDETRLSGLGLPAYQIPQNRDDAQYSATNENHARLLFKQGFRQTKFGQPDVDMKCNWYMSDIYTKLWDIGAQHGYSHDGVLWASGKYSLGFDTVTGDPALAATPLFPRGLNNLDPNNPDELSYILRGYEQPLIGVPYSSNPSGDTVSKQNILPIEDQACMSGLFPVQNITTTVSGSESNGLRYFGGGTSQFDMTYDTSIANRFAFTNCHQPYLLPNMAFISTSDGTKKNVVQSSIAGTQATKYNNTFTTQPKDPDDRTITSNNQVAVDMFGRGTAQYPIDSTSGICINNFAFERVKNTVVYKKLVGSNDPNDPYYNYVETLSSGRIKGSLAYYDSIVDAQYDPTMSYYTVDCNFVQNTPDRNNIGENADGTALKGRRGSIPMQREAILYELFTKKYEDFFDNEVEAKKEWDKSLWARMGFAYDQLGKISDKLETRSTYGFDKKIDELPLKGIITHNSFDFSSIVSTEGLGGGNPVQGGSAPNYDGTGLQNYYIGGYYSGSNTGQYQGIGIEYNIAPNIFHNQEDSQYVYAENLPDLNDGNSYYLVESDIVKDNYRDANNTKASLVGIISKQESTADTLFSVDGIEFTNTEERMLTSINLDIKNPDGTRASEDLLGQNSGFIFMIERAIQPQNVEMKML